MAKRSQLCPVFVYTIYPLTLPGVHNRDTIVNDYITTLDGAVGNEREV